MLNLLTILTPVDTVTGWDRNAEIVATKAAGQEKFWLIQDLWDMLRRIGVGEQIADLLAFAAAAFVLVGLVWFIDKLIIRLSLVAIKRAASKTKTDLDDILVNRKFFSRLLELVPLFMVWGVAARLFAGFEAWVIVLVIMVAKACVSYISLLISYSLLNVLSDLYMRKPQAQQRSIKGYVQVAKIVLGFIAGIVIISILLDKDPSSLFVGLGATAAIFTLVFKDTILGFVASIQLAAQDMVRQGDWIEMPSKNADGVVLDINVNSVKVQNWDNTVTMIPIYSMVSDSFTNWRGMENSAGRRFVRYININIESIVFADSVFLDRLSNYEAVKVRYDEALGLARTSSPDDTLTNLALFRAFIELFLKNHPKINQDLSLFVRYKGDSTEKGLLVEIYAFSTEKAASDFDAVHRSVIEYVVAVAPLFDIELFQAPSGNDFRQLARPGTGVV